MSDYDDSDGEPPSKRARFSQSFQPSMAQNHNSPSGFGRASRNNAAPSTPTPSTAGMSKFALAQMAKMGWKAGQGLGAKEQGRATPIETKLRPQGAGLGAVKEKTKQNREEEKRQARLRGEEPELSSDEERRRKKKAARKSQGGAGGTSTPVSAARRKPKYVTADQVAKELSGLNIPKNVLESALDLSGNTASPGTGFVQAQDDSEQAKATRRIRLELQACAETRHGLNDRKSYLDDTSGHLVDEMDRAKEELLKLRDFAAVVKELSRAEEQPDPWPFLKTQLAKLEQRFPQAELEKLGIHDVIVATIHPLFRSAMAEWEPPIIQEDLLSALTGLQHYFGLDNGSKDSALAERGNFQIRRSRKSTTAYETLLYTLFLPKVRTYINSTFDPLSNADHSGVPSLLHRWRPLLPPFIYSNILEQLIIPRLTSSLETWKPSSSTTTSKSSRRPPPDSFLFPYLPLLPATHLDPSSPSGLLTSLKRRFRSLLSTHNPPTGPPHYLLPWRPLLGAETYNQLLTTRLVPRLTSYLTHTLTIDPADQDVAPIEAVLCHAELLPPSTMAEIVRAAFLPQFAATLWEWLVSPGVRYAEVADWYLWWKGVLPASVREQPALFEAWTAVFCLMIRAGELGEEGKGRLEMPDLAYGKKGDAAASAAAGRGGEEAERKQKQNAHTGASSASVHPPQQPLQDSTFRDILEEWCAENDVLLVAMREAHEGTGAPLFRVTASADQRGGVVVYIKGDVLYARAKKDRSLWEPMGVGDELMARASGR